MCNDTDRFITSTMKDIGMINNYINNHIIDKIDVCSSDVKRDKLSIIKKSTKNVYCQWFKIYPDVMEKLISDIVIIDKNTFQNVKNNKSIDINILTQPDNISTNISTNDITKQVLLELAYESIALKVWYNEMIATITPWIKSRIEKFTLKLSFFLKYLAIDRKDFFKINFSSLNNAVSWIDCPDIETEKVVSSGSGVKIVKYICDPFTGKPIDIKSLRIDKIIRRWKEIHEQGHKIPKHVMDHIREMPPTILKCNTTRFVDRVKESINILKEFYLNYDSLKTYLTEDYLIYLLEQIFVCGTDNERKKLHSIVHTEYEKFNFNTTIDEGSKICGVSEIQLRPVVYTLVSAIDNELKKYKCTKEDLIVLNELVDREFQTDKLCGVSESELRSFISSLMSKNDMTINKIKEEVKNKFSEFKCEDKDTKIFRQLIKQISDEVLPGFEKIEGKLCGIRYSHIRSTVKTLVSGIPIKLKMVSGFKYPSQGSSEHKKLNDYIKRIYMFSKKISSRFNDKIQPSNEEILKVRDNIISKLQVDGMLKDEEEKDTFRLSDREIEKRKQEYEKKIKQDNEKESLDQFIDNEYEEYDKKMEKDEKKMEKEEEKEQRNEGQSPEDENNQENDEYERPKIYGMKELKDKRGKTKINKKGSIEEFNQEIFNPFVSLDMVKFIMGKCLDIVHRESETIPTDYEFRQMIVKIITDSLSKSMLKNVNSSIITIVPDALEYIYNFMYSSIYFIIFKNVHNPLMLNVRLEKIKNQNLPDSFIPDYINTIINQCKWLGTPIVTLDEVQFAGYMCMVDRYPERCVQIINNRVYVNSTIRNKDLEDTVMSTFLSKGLTMKDETLLKMINVLSFKKS